MNYAWAIALAMGMWQQQQATSGTIRIASPQMSTRAVYLMPYHQEPSIEPLLTVEKAVQATGGRRPGGQPA